MQAPVLILSTDSRSMMKNSLHVKVKEGKADLEKVQQVLADEPTMSEIRRYMLAC